MIKKRFKHPLLPSEWQHWKIQTLEKLWTGCYLSSYKTPRMCFSSQDSISSFPRWGKQSEFTRTEPGRIWLVSWWIQVCVCASLCVCSSVCYLLRSSSSWSWYSVNSLWNRRFSPMTGKTSRSNSRLRSPWKHRKQWQQLAARASFGSLICKTKQNRTT